MTSIKYIKYPSLNQCQTCLGDLKENLTLESLNESTDMLSLLTYFDVKVIKGLPNSICTKCVSTFESIISFKHQCTVSQNILLKIYNEVISTKEEVKIHKSSESTLFADTDSEIKLEDKESIKEEIENTVSDCINENTGEPIHSEDDEPLAVRKCKKVSGKQKEKVVGEILCKKCDFSCDTKVELDNHSQNKHDTVCNICNKKLVNNRNLRRHREIHQTDRPKYFCEICKKFYDSKQTYDYHIKKFHSNNHREKIVCTLCGISVYEIKNHLKSKHSDPTDKFTCKYCEKVFKSHTSLRCHALIYHENPESYQSLCPECGRVFRTSGDMKAHLRRKHSDERKFNCRHCDKTFKTCYHRGRHEKIVHFNERRYKCEICSKAFTEKPVLENHIRTHTGEKPFVCEICSRAFAQKVALRTHLKLVHGLEKIKSVSTID